MGADRPVQSPGLPMLRVPPAGPGVCGLCHGPLPPGRDQLCWCCRHIQHQLGELGTPLPLVAVGAASPGDPFHAALRRYKDAPSIQERRYNAALLGDVLSRFLAANRALMTAKLGNWDAVAPVPSTARGRGAAMVPCPIETVLAHVPAVGRARVAVGAGPGRCAHLVASADAFSVAEPLAGRRVLVFDDVWVTGARARSLAATLRGAGADVRGILVLARVVRPDRSVHAARWWGLARSAPAAAAAENHSTPRGSSASHCC